MLYTPFFQWFFAYSSRLKFSLNLSTRKVLTLDFKMTSSWLNWWVEHSKILKILKVLDFLGKFCIFWDNLGAFLKFGKFWEKLTKFFEKFWNKMPRQDAQTNRMPRCPTRCPDEQDVQMSSEMPSCPARCPDAQRDAQLSSEMPRCPTRCPDAMIMM